MPRGPDLSPNEVAMVHSKIKQFWDYEKAQIKHGGMKQIRKSCRKISGIPGGVYDSIEAKMPWLRGKKFVIQQDGARPHTASDTISDLEKAGTGEGWTPIIMTQPPNSPDVNINDLGFFHSLKTRVRQKSSPYDSREEMMANVLKTFEEYPAETLDGIWGCYYNNLRSIMACDGGNDYKQAHNGGKSDRKVQVLPWTFRSV